MADYRQVPMTPYDRRVEAHQRRVRTGRAGQLKTEIREIPGHYRPVRGSAKKAAAYLKRHRRGMPEAERIAWLREHSEGVVPPGWGDLVDRAGIEVVRYISDDEPEELPDEPEPTIGDLLEQYGVNRAEGRRWRQQGRHPALRFTQDDQAAA